MKTPNDPSETAANLRKRAEAIVRENTIPAPEDLEAISSATRQALHELRVHQIELEMQNEELRRAQTELEAVRARYFDLYDLAPVGYCTIGEKGLIQEANLTAAILLGVTRSELVRQPISRFIFNEDSDLYYLHRKQLFETGQPQECDLQMLKKDGTTFWAHLASTVVHSLDGVSVCRTVLSDITGRKLEERRQRLAKDVLAVLNRPNNTMDVIRDILLLIKAETGIEAAGIRLKTGEDFPYYQTSGFPDRFVQLENFLCARDPAGQLLRDGQGHPLLECMCGNVICGRTDPKLPFFTATGSFWTNSTTDLLASTTEAERQAHTRNRCHGEGYESVALIPLRAGDETIGLLQLNDHRRDQFTVKRISFLEGLGASIGIALSRIQAAEQLMEAQNDWVDTFDSITDMVTVHDQKFNIIRANQAAKTTLGLLEKGADAKCFACYHGTEKPPPGCPTCACLTTGQAATFELFEPHLNRHLEIRALPRFNRDHQVIGLIHVVRDITEHKQAEAELQQHREHLEELVKQRTVELAGARDQAQAANRAKSVFLANMSHELRTPLTSVLGFSEIMARDPAIPGRAREYLAIILRSGEHLLALINDILDLSKIDAGRVEIELHDVDLGELVHDVVNMMRIRAEAKGLRLVLDPDSNFPRFINTDADKFRQILVNLVGNAIKFTHDGQVAIKLNAKTTQDGNRLTVEVRDTGIGISQENQDRIFLPFEQVINQVAGGTGLGLAISCQYVQMLGGKITVDSELGKGSRFCFTIPVICINPANAETSPIHQHLVGIASPTADFRILIVEDQLDNRLLLQALLSPLHFQLREAVNGREAIALFLEWRPHLIFMDRRMPVLDGLAATRRIRALPGGRETIVIAVSAHSFKEEQQEMLAAGCNDFLSKPFDEDDLLILLKKHLHLNLVYAADETLSEPVPLATDDLRILPPDALATLSRLANECDDAAMANWLQDQNTLTPAAKEALSCLIKNYQFDVILEVLRPLMPGNNG